MSLTFENINLKLIKRKLKPWIGIQLVAHLLLIFALIISVVNLSTP